MLRLIILVFGILGASLHGVAWAGENVRVFASELLAFESRQVLQPEPPVKYSDASGGAELRKLLDPVRAPIVVNEYFEGVEKQLSEPEVTKLLQPLMVRYEKAFDANPRAYEEEYLDALNWTVLILQRSVRSSALALPARSAAPSEEEAAMQRLLESLKGLTDTMLGLVSKGIRSKVAKDMFSEAGGKRALEMADRLAPPSAGVTAAAPLSSVQTQTRNLVSGEQVYRAQCIACHATGIAGSPKQGDVAAWAPRIRSGLASMLQSTLKGKGAMGAQGGGDFQDIELARAVVYLANSAGGRFPEPPVPAGHPGTVTFTVRPPPPPPPPAVPYAVMSATQKMVLGERTYASNCAACHQANGRGAGPIPDLHKTSTFAKTDAVIDVVLHGSKNSAMPSWRALQNEEIAEVINYMRFKFSSELAQFVTPEDVRSRRK
ncbi:Cytochrome c5 [Polaromonas sp. YR568]|uniref:c-type cytochrome n=1 Tax=Polaromonas sp. YR568 TaxID=1855301 RepID=UPI0008EB8872|nr:c-type cytochrome [Polaromonas sp. YR568]SFU33749.1 Cytochrome c5 [Polaromonas sp. YR568]